MKKITYLFLLIFFVFACAESDTENSIQNLTDSEHIELIKNHNDKVPIGHGS